MYLRVLVFTLLSLPIHFTMRAQAPAWSPHQEHLREFERPDFREERDYDREHRIVSKGGRNSAQKCVLQRQVYGFHPFWMGSAYTDYDFGLLSTVAYYGCAINPAGGRPADAHGWMTTGLVDTAHARGSRVDLVAYLYGPGEIARFLSDTLRQQATADSLAALVRARDADGICLDFQGVDEGSALEFARFVRRQIIALRSADPGYELSLVLPSIDPAGSYDAGMLHPYVDRFIVAAYDFHDPHTATTGPVAPFYNATASFQHYLDQGAPPEKLLAGVPYFGYRWKATSLSPAARATSPGKMVTYRQFREDFRGHTVQRDTLSDNSFLAWEQGSSPEQVWVDDRKALDHKYEWIIRENLAGVGIWALGYGHGQDELWDLIRERFADCNAMATEAYNKQTRILDGPTSAERNKDNWIWIVVGTVGLVLILVFVRRMR